MTDIFPDYGFSKPCDLCGKIERQKGFRNNYNLENLYMKNGDIINVCFECMLIISNYENNIKRNGILLKYDDKIKDFYITDIKYNNKYIFYGNGNEEEYVICSSINDLSKFLIIFNNKRELDIYLSKIFLNEVIEISKKFNKLNSTSQNFITHNKIPHMGNTNMKFEKLKKIVEKRKKKI